MFIERSKAESAPKSVPKSVINYEGSCKRRLNYDDSDSKEEKPPAKLVHKMYQLKQNYYTVARVIMHKSWAVHQVVFMHYQIAKLGSKSGKLCGSDSFEFCNIRT
ncbi:hypothetical protein C8J57DRAFT_1235944 [Mycena rebaudengoi]|nr:hypothetical protein C8J57DRAFT_1235944 [Mycena rebaudengoi]